MTVLVDTHILVWLMRDPEELNAGERALLARPPAEILVSAVTLWELRLKWGRRYTSGARKGPADPSEMLAWVIGAGFTLLDLSPNVAVATLDPPLDHSDPFDELLLTQAQQGGYRLLTRDDRLASHPAALVA
jgi:PIN domain nuclease of toxin-antitoxin system